MKKRLVLGYLAAVMAAVILLAFSGFAQEDVKTVDDSGFRHHLRSTVPFDHDKHNEMAHIQDCGTCHHLYENGKKVEGQTSEGMQCSECHLAKGQSSKDLIKSYHALCKGCHMKEEEGPITCAECHPKR